MEPSSHALFMAKTANQTEKTGKKVKRNERLVYGERGKPEYSKKNLQS